MANRRSFLLMAAFALLCHCAQGGSPTSEGTAFRTGRGKLTIKGSDTMVILGQRWAEAYAKVDPTVIVQVSGGGTGTGIAALINGSTDMCEASRPMTDRETEDLFAKRRTTAVETKVALDAVAVYVNADNPVEEISLSTLARIYTGEMASWKEVGGPAHAAVLYGRENNSGTYGYFKERVLAGKDFAPGTHSLAGTAAVANAVKGDVFGIGYGGIAYLEGIKALRIRREDGTPATAPSFATTQNGSYLLSRFLYLYTAGKVAGDLKKFIDWVKGPEGQTIIADVGYYPLPKGPGL